jgi:hypothetical protein
MPKLRTQRTYDRNGYCVVMGPSPSSSHSLFRKAKRSLDIHFLPKHPGTSLLSSKASWYLVAAIIQQQYHPRFSTFSKDIFTSPRPLIWRDVETSSEDDGWPKSGRAQRKLRRDQQQLFTITKPRSRAISQTGCLSSCHSKGQLTLFQK